LIMPRALRLRKVLLLLIFPYRAKWHLASALRVEPWTRGKPVAEIRVRLKNGGNLTLGVLARQPDLVLVRTDEKMQYHLRSEAAKRLFSPPRAERSEPAKK
jgi:hypothetical protein